jgi:hypothetical protein
MTILLALALTGQPPSSGHASDIARNDLLFARAVEESVMAAAPTARPPAPYRVLMRMMGDPSWRTREYATAFIEETVRANRDRTGAVRWLFWGRRSEDAEIASRCNAILRRLHPCLTCKGSGRSKDTEWPCWDCQGTATLFWPSIWD